jgi:hypothetical protein
MSKLYVNEIVEATAGAGVYIPGSVVQMVDSSSSTQYTTTSTSYTKILGFNFTPKFATSKLIVHAMVAAETLSGHADMGTRYRIFSDNTGTTPGTNLIYESDYTLYNSNSNAQKIQQVSFLTTVNASNLTTREFSIWFSTTRSGYSARCNFYGSPTIMMVTEVAQ